MAVSGVVKIRLVVAKWEGGCIEGPDGFLMFVSPMTTRRVTTRSLRTTLFCLSATLVLLNTHAQSTSDLQGVWYNENTVFLFEGGMCEYLMFGGEMTEYTLNGNVLSIKEKPYYIRKENRLVRREGEYFYDFEILKLARDSLVLKAANEDARLMMEELHNAPVVRLRKYSSRDNQWTNADAHQVVPKLKSVTIVYKGFNGGLRDSSFVFHMSIPPDQVYMKKTGYNAKWKGFNKGQLSGDQARGFTELVSQLDVRDFTAAHYMINDGPDATRVVLAFEDGSTLMTNVSPGRYYRQLSAQLLVYYLSQVWHHIPLKRTEEDVQPVLEGRFSAIR